MKLFERAYTKAYVENMASLVQKECREEAEAEETERRRLEEAAAEEKNGPMTTAQKVRQKNS